MGLPRRSFGALRLVPSTCRPGPVPTRGNLLRRAHAGSLFRLGPAVEIPIPPTHSSHRRYVAPRRSGSGLAVSTPVAPPPEEADAAEKREHWPGWCSVERNGERHSDDGEHERNCLAGSVLKHDRPVLLKPLALPCGEDQPFDVLICKNVTPATSCTCDRARASHGRDAIWLRGSPGVASQASR